MVVQHAGADGDDPAYFDRRPAASGALSYGDRLRIRDTSHVLLEAIPFFIPHKSGSRELSIKLVRTDKRSGEQCEMTLKEEDLRVLKRHIAQALAVSGQDDDGQYLVLRTDALAHQLDVSDDAVDALGHALGGDRFAARLARQVDPQTLAKAFSAAVWIGGMANRSGRRRKDRG